MVRQAGPILEQWAGQPYSQADLPHVGQQSLEIDSSTSSLVLSGPVTKGLYHSYSPQQVHSSGTAQSRKSYQPDGQ
jgi:hypothetical protein